jgi:hypothetical protein
MLQNLKDLSGSAVPIRVGGTTANHAIWTPGQKEAIIQNFAVPGADQPANVTWGPAYIESFKTFPNGTKYTIGVTFDSGAAGEEASITETRAFYEGIGSDLYAIEVGNEFDGKCSIQKSMCKADFSQQYSQSAAITLHGQSVHTYQNG